MSFEDIWQRKNLSKFGLIQYQKNQNFVTKSKNSFTLQNNLRYNFTMPKKVIVNIEKVKQPKHPKPVKFNFKKIWKPQHK